MGYFIFNSVRSDTDLHIMITKPAYRPTWKEEKNYTTVPYRRRRIQTPSGVYENAESLVVEGVVDAENSLNLYSFLNGSGELILSSNPNESMTADVEGIKFNPVSPDLNEVTINFTVMPFARRSTETPIDINTYLTPIENEGNIEAEPVITFKMHYDAEPILKGDVNFDGKIDATDASLVLAEYSRVQAGEPPTFTPEQFEAADMDNDGRITAMDASEILRIYAEQQSSRSNVPSKNVIITTNGEDFIIGVPDAAIVNQFYITIDSENKLLYYTNEYGDKVNILQYSYGDFPLLSVGMNYLKYTGDCEECTIKLNERWL